MKKVILSLITILLFSLNVSAVNLTDDLTSHQITEVNGFKCDISVTVTAHFVSVTVTAKDIDCSRIGQVVKKLILDAKKQLPDEVKLTNSEDATHDVPVSNEGGLSKPKDAGLQAPELDPFIPVE